MELCDNDLNKWLNELEGQQMTEDLIMELVVQMSSVSRFLFDNNVIHRDIKPSNILVNFKGHGQYHVYKLVIMLGHGVVQLF